MNKKSVSASILIMFLALVFAVIGACFSSFVYIDKKIKFEEIKLVSASGISIFEDEKFVTESVYYNQFFYDYKFATFKEEVYLAEFQDDGYTKMGMRLFEKNPKGYAYALKQNACLAIKQKSSFKEKVKKIMAYYGWKSLLKTPKEIANEYNIPCFYKFIGWLTTPLSNVIIKRRLKKWKQIIH